jgi:hypothetical protein
MTDTAAAHNAIVSMAAFYGSALAEQQSEIAELQAKLEAANQALAAAGEQLRGQSKEPLPALRALGEWVESIKQNRYTGAAGDRRQQVAHDKLFNTCLALKGIAALPKP